MGARKNTKSKPKPKPKAHRRKTVEDKKSTGLSLTMQRRISEGALIVVGAIALYLLIALVTYHSSDPSWSNSGSKVVANAGGRVGAWLADVLLYAFGYPAYIFPILLAVSAWVLFRDKRAAASEEHELSWGIIALRIIGFVLVLLTTCGLCSLLLPHLHAQLPINDAGGIGGSLIAGGIGGVLNKIGGSLVLTALLLVGITLFAGLSWVTLMHLAAKVSGKALIYTKRAGVWTLAMMVKSLKQSWEQYKDYREKRAEEKANKPTLAFPDTPARSEKPAPIIKPMNTERKIAPAPPPPIKAPAQTSVVKKPLFKRSKQPVSLASGELPPLSLLDQPAEKTGTSYSKERLTQMSEDLEKHLAHFNIDARVVGVEPGPVVTRFEVALAPGVKVSKVSNVDKDLARSMSTSNVRVVEVIPGKSVIGLEIPNEDRAFICLSEILDSETYRDSKAPLTLALGKDIAGHPVIADLAKMPHLLVAGTTGSGKSVSMNTMLLSMLYKSTPKELRLILIDPKMLELSIYQGIPHLLTPVVTDMKEAANALRWCVVEMDRRYALMANFGVRNLASLNQKIADAEADGEPLKDPIVQVEEGQEASDLVHLPNVVVLIDELADMMMVVGKKVEELIARIAQKARAAGIHMVLATQRPSVDVITGLIKANIPARMAFNVSSRIDSRTILDQQGAQQLLGQGDMLFLPSGSSIPQRVHGPFVSDDEIHRIVGALKKSGQPQYMEEIIQDEASAEGGSGELASGAEADELYDQAVQIVTETRRASISLVQRRLRIGYNRAANLLEAMEAAGVVTTMQGNGSREVLAPEPVKD